MFDTVALQGSEIVAIAELREQALQDPPVPITSRGTEGALEMILQVLLDPVVVEQRVVHVDEEDDRMRQCHSEPRRR